MFGDPNLSSKKWPVHSIESVCSDIYGGGTPSKSHPEYYCNGKIPWISSKDMKFNLITDSKIHINQCGIDHSTAKIVPKGSVIIVVRSGILKHTFPVAVNVVPITINQDLKALIPNKQIMARFLAVQLKMLEKSILTNVRAVTADNIEFGSFKRRNIFLPPLNLQNKFVKFLVQIDKSRLKTEKSSNMIQHMIQYNVKHQFF